MIKYLDDEVLASFGLYAHPDTKGTYQIQRFIRYNSDDRSAEYPSDGYYITVFVGNVFIPSTSNVVYIYMNDIVESQKINTSVLDVENKSMHEVRNLSQQRENSEPNYTKYKVILNLEGIAEMEQNVDIYLGYRYPTQSSDLNMIGLPDVKDAKTDTVMLLREGFDLSTGESTLLPRIPNVKDGYFTFGAYVYPTWKYLQNHYLQSTNGWVAFGIDAGDRYVGSAGEYKTNKWIPQYATYADLLRNVKYTYTEVIKLYRIEYYSYKHSAQDAVDYLVERFGIERSKAIDIVDKEAESNVIIDGLSYAEMTDLRTELYIDDVINFNVIPYTQTITKEIDVNALKLVMDSKKPVYTNYVIQESIDDVDRDVYIQGFLMDICGKRDVEAFEIWDKLSSGIATVVYSNVDEVEASRVYSYASRYGDASIESDYEYIQMTIPVAKIDFCPSRYYIVWLDRMGGLQCQPFTGAETYTEKLSNTLIQNQYNQKRLGVADVTPSWKLTSGWIKEKEYAVYESILVSPKVVLIDTENKVAHNVIITDTNYTEKTRKNQNGQLINFSINVQLNKNQRITY